MNQLPLVGFNSSRYDLNFMKSKLFSFLNIKDSSSKGHVIKRNNTYTSISNEQFKFLDIMQFLAPGCSYSKFLKAFKVEESKGFFPYEYLIRLIVSAKPVYLHTKLSILLLKEQI